MPKRASLCIPLVFLAILVTALPGFSQVILDIERDVRVRAEKIIVDEYDPIPLSDWNIPSEKGEVASTVIAVSEPSHLFTRTPCRVIDTRNTAAPFGGPAFTAGQVRTFTMPSGSCGIPTTASAYSLNITVTAPAAAGWLTAWNTGATQPTISTLNYAASQTIANAAIVPAGIGGAISIYSVAAAHVIVDINGYFKPAGPLDSHPIAFAYIESNGTKAAGTSNVACIYSAANSEYECSIAGEIYYYNDYITTVTLSASKPTGYIINTNSYDGKLVIQIWNSAGTAVQWPFQFVVWKP